MFPAVATLLIKGRPKNMEAIAFPHSCSLTTSIHIQGGHLDPETNMYPAS